MAFDATLCSWLGGGLDLCLSAHLLHGQPVDAFSSLYTVTLDSVSLCDALDDRCSLTGRTLACTDPASRLASQRDVPNATALDGNQSS